MAEKFLKVKEFYLLHKSLINLGVSMLLFFVSTFWFPMMFVCLAWIVFSYVLADINEAMGYTLFYVMFSAVLPIFAVSLVCLLFGFIIRYVIDVKKKRAQVFKLPLMLTSLLTLIGIVVGLFYDKIAVDQGFVTIVIMFFVYFFFVYRKQINARKVSNFLLWGMIVSVAMSLVMYLIPACETLAYDFSGGIKMKSVNDIVVYSDGSYSRLVLLTFHVNHLSCFVVFAIAYICHVIMSENKLSLKEKIFYFSSLVLAIIVGVMTLSKSFIVVFAIMLIYMLVYIVKKYKLKSLYLICPLIVVGVIGCVVFWDKVEHVFSRFVAYSGSFLDMITTGRASIWKTFMEDMFLSPLKIIFGAGFLLPDVVAIGTHSLYVYVFYRFGIAGTALLVVLALAYLKEANLKWKFDLKKILPFAVMLLFALQEACVDERFLLIVVGAFLMFESSEKVPDTEKIKNIDETLEKNEV